MGSEPCVTSKMRYTYGPHGTVSIGYSPSHSDRGYVGNEINAAMKVKPDFHIDVSLG